MDEDGALIRFRLDPRSGVPAYRQLIDQVRQAVSLGLLHAGDQLPPVREVVNQITINPNTVHRAYRDLEAEGLVHGQQGRGTFVVDGVGASTTPEGREQLQNELLRWLDKARQFGMDNNGILALIATSLNATGDDMEAKR